MKLNDALRQEIIQTIFDAHLDTAHDMIGDIVMDGCPGLNNMSDEELMDDLALICGEDCDLFQRCEADLGAQAMLGEEK